MAMTTTVRRSDPHAAVRSADFDAARSPLHAERTPRPSISPLSMASKPNASSPVTTREIVVPGEDGTRPVEPNNETDGAGADASEEIDDRSSSLSDPEDGADDALQHNGVDEDTMEDDEGFMRAQFEADSEAETERLEQTPQKLRRHTDSIGKTPSKLSQFANVNDERSEPQSPLAPGAGPVSSTSTFTTAGQKRKRSDTADSSLTSAESDFGESPRKRSHETRDDPIVPNDNNEDPEAPEDNVDPDAADVTPAVDETPVPSKPIRGVRGKRGRHKGKKRATVMEEPEVDTGEETGEPDDQPDDENSAKSEEYLVLKKEASMAYEGVVKHFRAFKERLYNERLAAMNSELQMLASTECAHPEYLRQVACVDARFEKQKREAHAYYRYRLQCVRDRTLGERSQLHSQFFQHVREQRENAMYHLGEDWYAIQKERRQSHQEDDGAYVYKFPVKKSLQIRHQGGYNQEVSILSGMAKYIGFPAAPSISGVEADGIEDDMQAMKITKLIRQPAPPPRPLYLPPPSSGITQNERLAHEQFIEQTPWARPQGPLLSQGTPNISHTPNWAEPTTSTHNSAKHLIRNLSGQVRRASSAYATPLPQKRVPMERSSSGTLAMLSDGAEAPSSTVVAPPTQDRVPRVRQGGNHPASPMIVSKQRQDGPELTGYRNISNVSAVSGASTIDDPLNVEAEVDRVPSKPPQIGLSMESSVSRHPLDTNQLHRHLDDRRDVFHNAGFRPQEGMFGAAAPLPSTKTT